MPAQKTDPAALEAASRELEALAAECGRHRVRAAAANASTAPLVPQVAEVIGGAANSADTRMATHLHSATKHGKSVVGQLGQAQKRAMQLAAQARRQAAEARRAQADDAHRQRQRR